jgi:D-3-phosphoglycerate dehydrogenase
MMNKERLYKMKPESILINTSRGEVIDENALYAALKSNQISGAGLDVFEKEPYSGPLTELNNVVLTPHIGAYAKELRIQMEMEAAENLIKGLSDD